MRDLIGRTLGRYRIVEKIGEGGMGVVYRAHDERLDRDVAVKVLPEEVATNPDRLARFEREARAVAKLAHPNILAIHDFGNEDGIAYAVMELLNGESLREALLKAAGPLPWRRVQEIGAAVAAGLGAAHHQGIVHRDIKPENIFLVNDGQVKILDFGLAQIQEPVDADADTATLTPAGTVPGTVMGTVGYMSPEQVRGEPADARSDIFALGCVLYEMIAGRHAFKRETTAEIMTAILREEPRPLLEAGVEVLPGVEVTIERCLAKNPERRFQSARDLAFAMESLSGSSAPLAPQAAGTPHSWSLQPLLIAVLTGLLILTTTLFWTKPSGVDLGTYRFTPFATDSAVEHMAAWSPDGRSIAYVKFANSGSQLIVRSLETDSAPEIVNLLDENIRSPFWSPDGHRVWFHRGREIWSVGRAGGELEVAQQGATSRAGSLSPDGTTLAVWREEYEGSVFRAGVWLASPPTAEPRPYEPSPFEVQAPMYPTSVQFSPNGKKIVVSFPNTAGPEIWVLPFPDGGNSRDKPRRVFSDRKWTRTPHLSWMPDSRRIVMAFQKNPGSPHQLYLGDTRTERTRPLTAGVVDQSWPGVSPDGSALVFTSGQPDYDIVEIPLDGRHLQDHMATTLDEHSAAWVPGENRFVYMTDRSGHTQIRVRSSDNEWDRPVVSQSDFPDDATRIIRGPVVSPDGRLIAYDRQPENGQPAIWLSQITGGTPTRLIETSGAQYAPDWSPDGAWLSFLWANEGVFRLVKARVGSSKSPQILVDGHLVPSLVPSWSPTGEWILYFSNIDDEFGLKLIAADGGSSRFLADIGIPAGCVWSRDGGTIFAIKINPGTPQLLSIDVGTGSVSTIREFANDTIFKVPFSPGMRFTLAPDGKGFSATIVRARLDLWILEGFDSQRSWRDWLR